MNYISCIIRILEIPSKIVYFNKIPFIKFKAEITQIRNYQNTVTVLIKIWGNLSFDFIGYYQVGNYLLIEGYISNDFTTSLNSLTKYKKNTTLTIFQMYPYFY